MSNDLISREALKEMLKECAYSYDGVNTWIMKDEVLGIIDNAPTIAQGTPYEEWRAAFPGRSKENKCES